ncbi:hypothetical protein [Bradyrhizobium sp.]|uniref:hypothetical protein n=1 Tax=Bradyrhizobium sp. TaxID=376 RepID=UPI003C6F6276
MRHENRFGDTSPALLAGIEEIAGEIAARAVEIEEARRVPLDLIDQLYRCLPRAGWTARKTGLDAVPKFATSFPPAIRTARERE